LRLWASQSSSSGWKRRYSSEAPYDPVMSFGEGPVRALVKVDDQL